MYINSDYENYKYLVDYSDNYIVLSTSSKIYGSSGDIDTIPVVVQYLTPSPLTIETTYSSYETSSFSDVSDTFSQDFFDRADSLSLFGCHFIFIVFIVFIFNQLTKLFKKGGIFGSFS